jgi:hypothetical protein
VNVRDVFVALISYEDRIGELEEGFFIFIYIYIYIIYFFILVYDTKLLFAFYENIFHNNFSYIFLYH